MNWFRNPRFYADGLPGVGLLFLRLFIGYAMTMHGLEKLAGVRMEGGQEVHYTLFNWMPGAGVPGFLQALGAAGEFFGGLGIFFGALTPIASLGVMSTMFVAILSTLGRPGGPHYFIKPQSAPTGDSYELAAVYFIFALTIFLTGPGILSIDAFLAKFVLGPKAPKKPKEPVNAPPPAVAKTS